MRIGAELFSTPASPLVPAWSRVARAISRFHRIWPVAGLAFAMIITAASTGLLVFEFFKLIKPAFFKKHRASDCPPGNPSLTTLGA